MADTLPKSRRRWFSFSLRTLFVVVTVFGVWFGHEVNVVRNRRVLLAPLAPVPGFDDHEKSLADGQEFCFAGADSDIGDWLLHYAQGASEEKRASNAASVPWYRRLLGDRPIVLIYAPTRDADALSKAFPEAAVLDEAWHSHYDGHLEFTGVPRQTDP